MQAVGGRNSFTPGCMPLHGTRPPGPPPRRAVVDGVLSPDACRQLRGALAALGGPGYRPGTVACTLPAVLRTSRPGWALPLVAARERVLHAVERALGLEAELIVEFTGLLSWGPGAGIGWHRDDRESHLEQRYVSAVVYLNSPGEGSFTGGTFAFRDPHQAVVPAAGRLVTYTSDQEHRVHEVETGERFTLAMWFTGERFAAEHSEDAKLLRLLREPAPAPLPDEMFLGVDGGGGPPVDQRARRLEAAGLLARRGELGDPALEDLALARFGCFAGPTDTEGDTDMNDMRLRLETVAKYTRSTSAALDRCLDRWVAMGALFLPEEVDERGLFQMGCSAPP